MKQKTLSQLKKKADKVFSEYVRRINADRHGRVACFTCGKVYHWKDLDCGHFHPRRHLATRWEITNCRPQCTSCNHYNAGETALFAHNLVKEYGVGILEELRRKRNTSGEIGRKEIGEVIAYYSDKIKTLDIL